MLCWVGWSASQRSTKLGFSNMATMIYSTLPSNHAERETFNVLKGGLDDWVVFYSAKVPQQDSPRPRQIDFVILTGVSAICLEVKGGIFSRRNSQWFNGKGKSVGDPIDQAESAMYTLKNHAVPELGRLLSETSKDFVANKELLRIIENDLRFEYALLLAHPNMVGAIDPPKRRDGWLLLDASHLDRPSRMYDALSEFARNQLPGQLRNRLGAPEYQSRVGAVRDLFRTLLTPADFDGTFVRVNKDRLRNINEQLLRLTEQQERAFRLPQNNDRVLVDGAGGTGKTILALGLARRCANAGDRVLFLCHSYNLCTWLRSQDLPNNVTVGVYVDTPFDVFFEEQSPSHDKLSLMLDGIDQEFDDVAGNIFASDEYPPDLTARLNQYEAALEDWAKEVATEFHNSGRTPPFDYLIIDEAQRCSAKFLLDLVNSALVGGLINGRWTMLGDFSNQAFGVGLSGMRDISEELPRWYPGINWSRDRLTINCRNSQPIAAALSHLATQDSYQDDPDFQVTGPEISIEYWDEEEEPFSILDRVVRELRGLSVQASRIVVLTTVGPNILTPDQKEYGGWRVNDITNDYGMLSNADLNHCWFPEFQGLECDVGIVLVGPGGYEAVEYGRRILYTAISRVKGQLIIIAHVSHKSTLESLRGNRSAGLRELP